MGLPAEKFESTEMYMPRKAFYVIRPQEDITSNNIAVTEFDNKDNKKSARVIPLDFSNHYRDLHKYVNKIGEKFWLSDNDDTRDPSEHLYLMSIATRHLNTTNTDTDEVNSDIKQLVKNSFIPASDLIDIAHANVIGKVPDYTGKKDNKGRLPRLRNYTYGEVHDEPQVRFSALYALKQEDYPAIEVVRSIEGWRWANNVDLSHDQHELGRLAFETYLFSIGSAKFLPALGQAATAYLK